MTTPATVTPHPRSASYYWKCDRPAAFHGTHVRNRDDTRVVAGLLDALKAQWPDQALQLQPAASQGNHLTFRATIGDKDSFIRVEDGPEKDDFLEVESEILRRVRTCGVPAPEVYAVDASRGRVPFAWQALENIKCPDLNKHFKEGTLDFPAIAMQIGQAMATWQGITPPGFGPMNPAKLRESGRLEGFHTTYAAYFHLHLDRHLAFLAGHQFITKAEAESIQREIESHRSLLDLSQGCLVHKDLALWNVLGTRNKIAAFIDYDDAIAGDPMDDFSLLGCFHGGDVLAHTLSGYRSIRPLPTDHRRRFWLHLLRNMIVKAVIRVGAGYFERNDQFFLIGSGSSGSDLKHFTHERLTTALNALRNDREIQTL